MAADEEDDGPLAPTQIRQEEPGSTQREAPTRGATPPRRRADGEDPHLGRVVAGRYRVLKKLGEGGMGVVYLAEHVVIEKKVALKILAGDFAKHRDLVARFVQEAKAASRIGHDNIVDVTDFGETDSGSVFFAMELLEGHDLAHHLRQEGALSPARAAAIMNQVCRALGAAHAKGIVHRDLKPENIFIVRRGGRDLVKVLDFGIAKVTTTDERGERLTHTGMIFGTPEYMAPEQARGDSVDHRADVYAAGCILYQMLTGQVPFRGESFMGVLSRHLEEPVEPPSRRAPGLEIAPALEAVVLTALRKERAERYDSMQEMAVALALATGGDPAQAWSARDGDKPTARVTPERLARLAAMDAAATIPEVEPRRVPWALLAAAVALIGGGVVLGAWLWPRPAAAPPTTAPPAAVPAPAPSFASQQKAAAPSRLSLTSQPPGAEVMRGPERLGQTPLTLALPPDTAPFAVTIEKKGHKSETLTLQPDRDREYVVELPALRPPARPAAPAPAPPPETRPQKPAGSPELKDVWAD